jgi:hypothetical protein
MSQFYAKFYYCVHNAQALIITPSPTLNILLLQNPSQVEVSLQVSVL